MQATSPSSASPYQQGRQQPPGGGFKGPSMPVLSNPNPPPTQSPKDPSPQQARPNAPFGDQKSPGPAVAGPRTAPSPMSGTPQPRTASSQQQPPPYNRVFGLSLEELYRRDDSAVPMVVYQCIQAVDLFGLEVEGIYRTSGNSNHIAALRAQFDHGEYQVLVGQRS